MATSATTRESLFWRYEGPTWIVAAVIYASWVGLMLAHDRIWLPLWIFASAYVVAWHFSLQHEAIHSWRSSPRWLRLLVVMPPIGLWLPFPLNYESHRVHHRNGSVAHPDKDTESYYAKQAVWNAYGPFAKAFLLFHQTLLGRLTIGPIFRVCRITLREAKRIGRGDYSHVPHWLVHIALIGLLAWWLEAVAGLPFWKYCLLVAYPAMSLGLIRSFTEHRAADRPSHRTAIVESNWFFGLLFLNNNLHGVHHVRPEVSWYKLPRWYREERENLIAHCGGFVFRGYHEVFRRFLVRPVFVPVHPTL